LNSNIEQLISQEAKEWIGTRFRHQGRIKISNNNKGGCDCLGLILGIANKFKIRCKNTNQELYSLYKNIPYNKNPDSNFLIKMLNKSLVRINNNDLYHNDIILFNVNSLAKHLAIFQIDNNTIIHASSITRTVTEHQLDEYWYKNIHSIYRYYI